MRKTYRFLTFAVLAGLVSPVFTSCTGSNQKKDAGQVAEETIKKEIEEYAYPLPSTFEVTNMLNAIEASYIAGIANEASKVDSYFDEKSKAVNLGIYTADLAYSTTYNQKSEIQSYFTASERLIRELDFTAAFDENLPAQIDENIDNKEKLVEIVTGMFQKAYSYLNSQGRSEMSYLVLTGSVVEGLYLTTHISANTFQNPKILEAILFQKNALKDLEKLMEPKKDSDLLKQAYADLQAINAVYDMNEGTTSMTEAQVLKLTETISKIRTAYVK